MLAVNAVTAMWESGPGSDHQLAWAHAFLAAARSFEHTAEIRALYTGENLPPGLALDTELRWAIVQALSARDAISDAEIDSELERDPSATGKRHAVMARAMAPTAEAKAERASQFRTTRCPTQSSGPQSWASRARFGTSCSCLMWRGTSPISPASGPGERASSPDPPSPFPTWPSTINADTLRAVEQNSSSPPTCQRRCADSSVRDARTWFARSARAADIAAGRADS